MTTQEILATLEELGTAQNRKVYKRHGAPDTMFGVSYANFAKLKKEIQSPEGKKGVNQNIAEELWDTGNMDARVLACMIAEPKKSTKQLVRHWAAEISYYPLADELATLISQTDYAEKLTKEWIEDDREYVRRIGWYIVAKQIKAKKFKEDNYYSSFIKIGAKILQSSPNRAKEAINNTLIAIGGINEELRKEVEAAAQIIGPVEIDHGDTSCQTFVIEDYLERIWLRKSKLK
ncbi:MAG: DNA alkylation repair protein [Cyclobacteriaceae bacterium]|nr:DNA alkylation repair protein [Cyclobacteriaceae bacterium]